MSGLLANHLNGGKWSTEEEIYAEALISAFKAGEIPAGDIEEGTSLRKFLAEKLLCSPKRVSKKYEGTNYNGKQVYIKKTNLQPSSPEAIATKHNLNVLERKFRDALALMQKTGSVPTKVTPAADSLAFSATNRFTGASRMSAAGLPPVGSASLMFPQVQSAAIGASSLELAAMQRYSLDSALVNRQLSSLNMSLMTLPAVPPAVGMSSAYGGSSILDAAGLPTLASLHSPSTAASLFQSQLGALGLARSPAAASSANALLMESILASENRLKRTCLINENLLREAKRPRHEP